mmetsp:Transcript_9776/g.41051  ORF Transcript_9776/g.41051 Transcript_9776/m.41051 type:complete len:210 (+) Transcript_9776:77-706(+)
MSSSPWCSLSDAMNGACLASRAHAMAAFFCAAPFRSRHAARRQGTSAGSVFSSEGNSESKRAKSPSASAAFPTTPSDTALEETHAARDDAVASANVDAKTEHSSRSPSLAFVAKASAKDATSANARVPPSNAADSAANDGDSDASIESTLCAVAATNDATVDAPPAPRSDRRARMTSRSRAHRESVAAARDAAVANASVSAIRSSVVVV